MTPIVNGIASCIVTIGILVWIYYLVKKSA